MQDKKQDVAVENNKPKTRRVIYDKQLIPHFNLLQAMYPVRQNSGNTVFQVKESIEVPVVLKDVVTNLIKEFTD